MQRCGLADVIYLGCISWVAESRIVRGPAASGWACRSATHDAECERHKLSMYRAVFLVMCGNREVSNTWTGDLLWRYFHWRHSAVKYSGLTLSIVLREILILALSKSKNLSESTGESVFLIAKQWKLDIVCGLIERAATYKAVPYPQQNLFSNLRKL